MLGLRIGGKDSLCDGQLPGFEDQAHLSVSFDSHEGHRRDVLVAVLSLGGRLEVRKIKYIVL